MTPFDFGEAMFLYINPDMFSDSLMSQPPNVRSFIELLNVLGMGRYVVFADNLKDLRALFSGDKSMLDYFKYHFPPPYVQSVYKHESPWCAFNNANNYTVTPRGAQSALRANSMAYIGTQGGMSVGLPNTSYGDDFCYQLSGSIAGWQDGKGRAVYLLSREEHQCEEDFKRWAFAALLDKDPDRALGLISLVECDGKHFGQCHANFISNDGWIHDDWVEHTGCKPRSRDKTYGNATFLPGLKFRSIEYRRLVRDVLKAAYSQGLYSQLDQNKFTVDTGHYIGAADGRPTSVIRLYVTRQNQIHVRPFEGEGMCAVDINIDLF